MHSLNPDDALRVAQAHFSARRLADASELCATVLAARPKHVDALALSGQIAFEQHRYGPAIKAFRKAIRAAGRRADLHALLAGALLVRGDLDDALAAFERAITLDRKNLQYVGGKAEVLERLGDHRGALALVRPSVEAGTAPPAMVLTCARALYGAHEDQDAIDVVLRGLDNDDLPGPYRRSLLFVLGHARHRQGDHDGAWAAWRDANLVDAPGFSPKTLADRHQALRRVFAAGAEERPPRAANDSQVPVFVVGMPRSGSTLVEQIIHAHSQAYGAGETMDVRDLTLQLPGALSSAERYPDCLRGADANAINELGRRLLERLRARQPKATRIVDKSLENIEHLGLIDLLVPRARVVHVLRDPMDVCFSCYINDLWPEAHPHASDLTQLGVYYRAQHALMDFWKENLPIALHEVRYEDLVDDQETVTRRLLEFLGLPWDDRCLRFFEARRDVATVSYDQVRQPIYRSAKGRARLYEEHTAPLREALGDLARG